jgi:hypothetical protein
MAVPEQVRSWFETWLEAGRPCQAAVEWQRERWIERYPELDGYFSPLPQRLDREAIRRLVPRYPRDDEGAFRGLLAVFAWGWSQTRRGLAIARPVLVAGPERIGPKLLAIRAELESGGAIQGYSALMGPHKIDGLGQAFGTKLLHFLSPADDRALIADSVIAKAFRRAGLYRMPPAQCSVTRYRRYVEDMRAWAAELSDMCPDGDPPIAAEELEMIIFGFNASIGGPWALAL